MISTTIEGNITTYTSDNGRKVVVERIAPDLFNITCDNGKPFECDTLVGASAAIRSYLSAIPMQEFLQQYKGLLNQKGLAESAGRSINYMSHVATGRRPTSANLNKAIEESLRELGRKLMDINII